MSSSHTGIGGLNLDELSNDEENGGEVPLTSSEDDKVLDDIHSNADEEEGSLSPATSNQKVHFRYTDDISLKNPSSSVRFRGSNYRVFEQKSSQILLQESTPEEQEKEKYDAALTLRKVRNEQSFGLNCLRTTYTIVCLLFTSILFILSFLVLLFLFMDLVSQVGATGDENKSIFGFIGSIFSLPVLIYGLASAMSIAGMMVADTWSAHAFLRTVGNWSIIVTEWISIAVFILIPVLVCIISLFANSQNWWEITALTWFCCIGTYYVFFAGAVIYYEVTATMWFIRQRYPQDNWCTAHRRNLIMCQKHQLSGVVNYIRMTNVRKEDQSPREKRLSVYSRITLCPCLGRLYYRLDPPERIYSIGEVLGVSRFITSTSWSLEKVFCSRDRTRAVLVVRGSSAVTPGQVDSSLACAIMGNILAFLLFLAFLLWFQESGLFIALAVIVVCLCCTPRISSTARIYKMYQDVHRAPADDEDAAEDAEDQIVERENEGIYQYHETYRITSPTVRLCWVIFFLELYFLFIWPMIVLFATRDYAVGVLFIIISIVSRLRIYYNPAIVVSEHGSIDPVCQQQSETVTTTNNEQPRADKSWSKAKSRISTIILNVSRGPSVTAWCWIFFILAFLVILYAVASLGTSTDEYASDAQALFLLPQEQFAYVPQPNLPYPSCRLAKGLQIPGSNSTALLDYTFLAAMAYQPAEAFQDKLDAWFGDGVATDEVDIVKKFRQEVPGGQAPVSYHLVSFPNDFAVVIVRGSTTPWEWLTDAQLWSGAALSQIIMELLPAGRIWTPIIDEILRAIYFVESKSLKTIALYQQTTTFVQALQESGNYTTLHITGQSLGGGISIITGAQTGIPTIAISGPNAMLSRRTFDPPITVESLNEHVFNVIPDRDLVPRVDLPGDLIERIKCRAPKNNIWGCHSSVRSLCEVSFTCGTGNRPAVCDCATKYGYPEPIQTGGDSSFTDFCGDQRINK